MSLAAIAPLTAALADRYRFERRIGAGGMATVFLAEDLKHGRKVAVKVLDPQLAASVGADRFLREIRITAGLQHPNILTLIDSGEANGFLYYVMPYAEGETLRQRLTRAGAALPHDEAFRILREMLDALAHAHAQGLVHRDVKPENVMLTGRHAVVLDFGVAKAVQNARDGARRAASAEDGTALTSVGISLGTPAYMAPEQAAGDPDVDHRADLYSVGLVAYEMLSGAVPFTGRPHEVLAAQVAKQPAPLSAVAPTVLPAIAQLVMQLLAKSPGERPANAEAVIAALDAALAPPAQITNPWKALESRLGRGGARLAAGLVAALLLGTVAFSARQRATARWVREVAEPNVMRLLDASRPDSAYLALAAALERAPRDTLLTTLVADVAVNSARPTTPAHASVEWSPAVGPVEWRPTRVVGDSLQWPRGLILLRISAEGYRSRVLLTGGRRDPGGIALSPTDSPNAEMELVTGATTTVVMPGLSDIPSAPIPTFWMDRTEVTNAEFKKFVDAGGYGDAQWWTDPVRDGGRTLTVAELQRRFVDRTGRPGPATWEGGTFPAGRDQHPVGGISWFEARAYARFVGKELPSIYHWSRAAATGAMSTIVRKANFASEGSIPVATSESVGPFGTYDMAGNVREWVANEFGTQHFILGGGWTDLSYAFVDAYAQAPLDRSPTNGVRLIRREANDSTPAFAWAGVARQMRDYRRERPVGDAVYRTLAGTFVYDPIPVDAVTESVDSTDADFVREVVTVSTVYGDERMPIHIFRPHGPARARQVVVLFPGSNAFGETVRGDPRNISIDAIVRSGRIVVWPTYASQYERRHTLDSDAPRETAKYRDHVAMWVKDARRTVDYVVTRPDVDTARIGYLGVSFGGRMAPIILALEPRFKAAMLNVAGLKMERPRPESDPLNFLPRVRIPVLMLNGEFDHYFPLETSQKPFFAMLGTPAAQKRHVVFQGGHSVPRTIFLSEGLRWFDTYLGPVER